LAGKLTNLLSRILFSPEEGRIRAGWRILVMFVLYFLCSFLLLPFFLNRITSEQNPSIFFLINSLISAIPITVATFFSRKKVDRRSITSLGLPFGRKMSIDLFVGIGIAGLMVSLMFLLERIFGWSEIKVGIPADLSIGTLIIQILILFFVCILIGWGEELLFRGYLFVNIQDGMNTLWSIVLTSIFFAFAHYLNPFINFFGFTGLLITGLFFAFSRIKSKALWLPIGIHIGWNFFEGPIFGFPVSGLEMEQLLTTNNVGPSLITGGNFGPEAGLILFPALILGFLLVFLFTKLS
jgi:membrane protease YdiL (CAAX protease family)